MKKFLYHYLNLLIAAIQLFLAICMVLVFFEFEFIFSDIIVPLLIFAIPNIVISLLDGKIRDFHYPGMIIFSFLFSPLRLFTQLFTTIRLHILTSKGIRDYAERNDYAYNFFSALTYVLFSTDHPFVEYNNGKKNIKLSKKAQAEKDRRDQVMREIEENRQGRINAIKRNRGSLTQPNVLLVPIILFDNKVKYFGAYDGVMSSYYINRDGSTKTEQIAHISRLEIDGVNYLRYPINTLASPTGLFLKPGTYKIKIDFHIKIAPPIFGKNFSPKIIKTSTSINNFIVNNYNEDLYIGLVVKMGFGWIDVTNKYGQRIEDRDSSWDCTYSFRKYSFSELNSLLYNTDKNWFSKSFKIED